jgi:hypothetical protein
MPYTRTSLVVFWVVILALFALAGSGAVAGPWRLLLVALALAAPAVILKDSVLATAPAREHRPEPR